MTVTRADIIVLGDVQGVGYRYFVRKVAWKNKISGQVGNLEDGTVKIICEGNENNIKNFLKLIDIKKPPIAVERIDVEFSKASGEFKGFRIVAGALEEEMIEGFSTGASYFEVMFDKQDLLLKITERGFAEVKEEMAKGFGDMRQGFSEVKEEIHLLRDDFRELFMHEVSELRGEIAEIKSTLARMQAG
jgi:acylphosphatase